MMEGKYTNEQIQRNIGDSSDLPYRHYYIEAAETTFLDKVTDITNDLILSPQGKEFNRKKGVTDPELDDDPIGTHICNILNSTSLSDFSYQRFQSGKGHPKPYDALFPLLSTRNWNRLRYFLLNCFWKNTCNEKYSQSCVSHSEYPKNIQSLKLMSKSLVMTALFFSISTQFYIVYVFETVFLIGATLCFLVIDYRDILHSCPTLIKIWIDAFYSYLNEVEAQEQYVTKITEKLIMNSAALGLLCKNINWDEIHTSIKSEHGDDDLAKKKIEHLTAIIFSFVMVHGIDHKSLTKSKKRKANALAGIDKPTNHVTTPDFTPGVEINKYFIGQRRDGVNNKEARERDQDENREGYEGEQDDNCRRMNEFDTCQTVQSYDAIEVLPSDESPTFLQRSRLHSDSDINKLHEIYSSEVEKELNTVTDEENSISNNTIDSPSTNSKSKNVKSIDDKNMKWLDVGAKIGMRLLKSERVQKVITSYEGQNERELSPQIDTDIRIDTVQDEKDQVDPSTTTDSAIAKPFHTIWTPTNAGSMDLCYNSILSENSKSPFGSDLSFEDSSPTSEVKGVRKKSPRFLFKNDRIYAPNEPMARTIPSQAVMALKRGNIERRMHNLSQITASSSGSINSFSSYEQNQVDKRHLEPRLSKNIYELGAVSESLDATLSVPETYNANHFLPSSMTICHDVTVSSNKERGINTTVELKGGKRIQNFNSSPASPKGNRHQKPFRELPPLLPGVKVFVPMFPYCETIRTRQAYNLPSTIFVAGFYQMGTVITSCRINDILPGLSITLALDQSLLRDGKFAEMTLRVLDSQRQMPRHSKFPIGSCVATSFGIGVLVGWRVEDDCHIIRSLWQKRGKGAGRAYLNRNALHDVMEASVGFQVDTSFGSGKVVGFVMGGRTFCNGKYLVQVKDFNRLNNTLMTMRRSAVMECKSATFIPVVEQFKEAAKYQIQVDNYEVAMLQRFIEDDGLSINKTWRIFSEGFELFLSSFIKAAEEDANFDSEISNFLSSVIEVLEGFDLGDRKKYHGSVNDTPPSSSQRNVVFDDSSASQCERDPPTAQEAKNETGSWIMDLMYPGVLKRNASILGKDKENKEDKENFNESYKKIYAFLRTITRTIAIARSSSSDKPSLKMALSIIHEVLLFIRTVIKVQQKNMSQTSLRAWKETLNQWLCILGPINLRLQKVSKGVSQKLEVHGNIAKLRAIRFTDIVLADDRLVDYLETGDISNCLNCLESAAVRANIAKGDDCARCRKIFTFLYNTMAPRAQHSYEAAARNGKKFTLLAKTLKLFATPGRSILTFLTQDDVLETIERVLVRVFEKETEASRIVNIYSWNFRTLRHLRILNNMAICGKLWDPVLDAANEEFSWAVSRAPPNTQTYFKPISKLFSLGVARFHELRSPDISAEWLDFLTEAESVKIIQELDVNLMRFLSNFCKDVEEMMDILPYYSSIDEDILNLIDEVDLDKVLKEAAEAFVDSKKFPEYVRQKSAHAISRFLDILPKISIPIERREIGDDWVLTCHGRNGKDLTLSVVNIEKDNLLCKVLGSGNVLAHVIEDNDTEKRLPISGNLSSDNDGNVEVSILDHVAELIKNAQNYGCWKVGVGGVINASLTKVKSQSLDGLPLSKVLQCAVELWENLEIDDDELVEITIRDISHQIQVQDEKGVAIEKSYDSWPEEASRICALRESSHQVSQAPSCEDKSDSVSADSVSVDNARQFDPRKDPTILFVGINQLTCSLDDFTFRVEPAVRKTVFDPIFEGIGSLQIKNASIKLRIECRKERIQKLGEEITVPILQLQELDLGLEKVKFKFKETGVDWVLNKIVSNFSYKITEIVKDNLKEQIALSINATLDNLNKYIEVNPDIMLKILGITMDDLEENIAWV